MNLIQYRFTLSNSTLGSLVITDPLGWDTIPISLGRHKDYSEVLKTFDNPLTFTLKAIPYLQSAIALGIDTVVGILVEISHDYGETFEQLFNGLIDLESKSEIFLPTSYKLQFNLKRNDLWTTFINRKSTAVNVKSVTDLDGNAVTPVTSISPSLPSQTVDKVTLVETLNYADTSYTSLEFDFTPTNKYGAVDLPNAVLSELQEKFQLPAGTGPDFPVSLMDVKESGVYDFDISVTFANSDVSPTEGPTTVPGAFAVKIRILGGVGGPVTTNFTRTDHGTFLTNQTSQFQYVQTGTSLKAGQQIFIYAEVSGITDNLFIVAKGIRPGWESYIKITGHTVFGNTASDLVLIHDALDATIRRISPTSLYSPFFGGAAQGYGSDGCGYSYALTQGLQLRGFDLPSKPWGVSFDDLWNGANPIWSLGLGTEVIGGVEKIYIDEKSAFFDSSGYSILINNVSRVTKVFKLDAVVKAIKIGYEKWQLSAGGSLIDDPQTQHEYASPNRLTGQSISHLSKFIAASLLIELTRRARDRQNQTWELDNDVFILKLLSNLTGPDLTGTATNLLNSTTRYNKGLTPARNFLRWLKSFNIGQLVGNSFKFVQGLGNYAASINITPDGCSGGFTGALAENANIAITSDVLHGVEIAQIQYDFPFTWEQFKLVEASKRKRIGLSTTDTGHEFYFIDEKFNFFPTENKANFTLLKAT